MKKFITLCLSAFLLIIGKPSATAQNFIADSACYSDFTYSVNNAVDFVMPGVAINFVSMVKGDNLKYLWTFGDGQTSIEANPMHLYNLLYTSDGGKYNQGTPFKVCLEVYNGLCKQIACKDVYPVTDSVIYPQCKASIGFYEIQNDSSVSIPENKLYQFKGISGNNLDKWFWTFGDYAKSTEQNPVQTLNLVWNEKYQAYGTEVNLEVITADSCVSNASQFVPWNAIDPQKCFVYFTYYRDSSLYSVDSARIQFYSNNQLNSRMITSDEELVSWKWDFGDGATSTEANPSHIFMIPRIKCGADSKCIVEYKVNLITVNASGCTAEYSSVVYPASYPQPSCQAKFSYVMSKSLPPVYSFKNESVWKGGKVYWSFGDGTDSYEENPSHVFKEIKPMPYDTFVNPYKDSIFYVDNKMDIMWPGNSSYTVCLTIYDESGCSSINCEEVYATPKPVTICNNKIKLSTSSILGNSGCAGTAWAELVNEKGYPVAASSYYWSNGGISPNASTLCSNTTYSVTITDYNGCTAAGSFAIMDNSSWNPYGNWLYEGKDKEYIFKYITQSPDYISTWKFNDSIAITGTEVPFTFDKPGYNYVDLVVTDAYGNTVRTERIELNNSATKIENKTIDNEFIMYPVPANNEITLSLRNAKAEYRVEIVDLIGKLRQSGKITNGTAKMNIANLSSGMYICRIISGSNVLITNKFIKK